MGIEHRLESLCHRRIMADSPRLDTILQYPSHLGGGEGSLRGGWGSCSPPALPSTHQANLILIGAVHGDPEGYRRAWKILEFLQPEVVTVEISPFSVRYRERQGARWQRLFEEALAELPPGAARHLAIRRVAAQIALPFEYRAARDFCGARGVDLKAVDLGGQARRHLPRYSRELLNPENLRGLLEGPDPESLAEFVAREFDRARRINVGRPGRRLPGADFHETRRRDEWVATRLRRLVGAGRRVAHLGGWEHLVTWEDGGGLLPLLADLQPVRLLLDEGDELFAPETRERKLRANHGGPYPSSILAES